MKKTEDAYRTLENINQWIAAADNKATAALGIIGIILTIFFTNNAIVENCTSITSAAVSNRTFGDIIFIALVLMSTIYSLNGIRLIFLVICPKLTSQEKSAKSIFYFGDIAQHKSFTDYQNAINSKNDDDILEDLQNQVYQNSIICNTKHQNLARGIKQFILGLAGLVALYLIGTAIY